MKQNLSEDFFAVPQCSPFTTSLGCDGRKRELPSEIFSSAIPTLTPEIQTGILFHKSHPRGVTCAYSPPEGWRRAGLFRRGRFPAWFQGVLYAAGAPQLAFGQREMTRPSSLGPCSATRPLDTAAPLSRRPMEAAASAREREEAGGLGGLDLLHAD